MKKFKFSTGTYKARPDDGVRLKNCLLTNAVRCVPPQNKPVPAEIRTCQTYLANVIRQMKNLKAITLLGRIAHDAALRALGLPPAAAPFEHGAMHDLGALRLADSYHCSRYNMNTRRLTPEMFDTVIARLAGSPTPAQ